jgi:hypothetical protein
MVKNICFLLRGHKFKSRGGYISIFIMVNGSWKHESKPWKYIDGQTWVAGV